MRKIILTTSLFFCLAITTVFAQVTPVDTTKTSTSTVGGVTVIDIATPVNGLSNNTYSDFNVSSDGVSLNNDVSNPNITDGNQASIIVNQVMGSNPSLLEGFLRTDGHGATIIIANPNGITCNGCQFITNGVGRSIDLVTGTYNIATGTYDSISDNNITIESGGFDAGSRTVNIQTNDFTNRGLFYAGSVNFSLAGTFNNSGIIWADNILDAAVNSINLTATDFINSGTFSATDDSFSATVDTFRNESGATIVAPDGCNIVYTNSYTDNGTSNCIFSIGGTIVIDIAKPVDGFSNNSVDDFSVSSYGTILNNSAGGGTAQLGNRVVDPNSEITGSEADLILFQITGSTVSDLGGTIEVFGAAEAGLIIANPNGIDCNGCGFINTNRVDLVTGSNYNFNTDNFNSIANTNIAIIGNGLDAASVDILNIHAGGFTNTGGLKANTFNLNVAGNFSNSGSITTDSLNITAGYTAINQGSIVSNSLNITAHDFFRNLTGGDISTDTLNIIAGGKVTNTANITVGTLNIIANDDSSRTNDTTGFYVSNRGNITADNFVITAVDNFYNRGNITTTSGFNTGARNIFFFNEEIDSFTGTYDGGTITLGGDSSFIAADGSIENYGNIDLGAFNLDITADSFTNQSSATVTADTLNLHR